MYRHRGHRYGVGQCKDCENNAAKRCQYGLCGTCCDGCSWHCAKFSQSAVCRCGRQASLRCDYCLCATCCKGCSHHAHAGYDSSSVARSPVPTYTAQASSNVPVPYGDNTALLPKGCGRGYIGKGVLPARGPCKFARDLERYPIPEEYRHSDPSATAESRLRSFGIPMPGRGEDETALTQANARSLLHELLWAEEAQGKIDIRDYDLFIRRPLPEVGFKSFSIYVPGLAEKRPSVLMGDMVWIDQVRRRDEEAFMGTVVQLMEQSIVVKVKATKGYFDNVPPFRVRFSFNRTPLRHMHRAVDERVLDVFSPTENFELLRLRATVDREYSSDSANTSWRLFGGQPEQSRVLRLREKT